MVVVVDLSFPKTRKKSCQSLRQVGLLDVCLSLSIALSTIQVSVRFNSVPPQFRRTPGEDNELPSKKLGLSVMLVVVTGYGMLARKGELRKLSSSIEEQPYIKLLGILITEEL
ncbi:hypothetical protein TNCV_1402271 [Trichonephila clavipes]|nr:hypothetical protein TNCV_1402271 [Trichonephila clavipes]